MKGAWVVGALLVCLALAWQTVPSGAHESRPVFVDIREAQDGKVSLRWKVPPTVEGANMPVPLLSPDCIAQSNAVYVQEGGSVSGRVPLVCAGGVAGRVLSLRYPKYNPSLTAVLRVEFPNGTSVTHSLGPDEDGWEVPAAQTIWSVVGTYAQLGASHILEGYDHLLFIACLIFIAGTWRRILLVITGFTLAHSVTLALSALRVIHIPIVPTEAVIALSVVLLAVELARQDKGSLTWRYPLAVSACFGLLHGLGFASALSDIGLPEQDVLAALFSFNLGVEIGQISFAAVLVGTMGVLARSGVAYVSDRLMQAQLVAYVAGPLAAYWLIERVTGF